MIGGLQILSALQTVEKFIDVESLPWMSDIKSQSCCSVPLYSSAIVTCKRQGKSCHLCGCSHWGRNRLLSNIGNDSNQHFAWGLFQRSMTLPSLRSSTSGINSSCDFCRCLMIRLTASDRRRIIRSEAYVSTLSHPTEVARMKRVVSPLTFTSKSRYAAISTGYSFEVS